MPITEILARNAALYGNDVSLVEINPEIRERHGTTWRSTSSLNESGEPLPPRDYLARV